MKKIIIFFLLALAVFSSCRKDDKSVFDKPADDRLNETLAKYQAQLIGAQDGWKAIVYPAGGGTYSFYIKFNQSNRVQMYADFDSVSAITLRESSYRLKAIQQPSLIFDTYTYIHLLADPNEDVVVDSDVNGGGIGVGLKSDYEFYFDSATADTIKLIGRFNGSKATFIKATSQEATAYNGGQLVNGLAIYRFLTYFKRFTAGTQPVDFRLNRSTREIVFSYVNASGALQTFSTNYYFNPGGIAFVNPLIIGNQTITGFNNIRWNAGSETISMNVNNAASTISGVVLPVKIDVAAPRRWRDYAIANGNDPWLSNNGFHVNGVDDAYGLHSLSTPSNRYIFLIYYPSYDPGIDLLAPVFLDSAQTAQSIFYGVSPGTPNFGSDGRIFFPYVYNFGTVPTTGPFALTYAKLFNSSGFYFVQTGPTTYDMVSALDGKSWISWRF